jgi:transaldolase/glucose-6-phosphate isomerase
MENNPLRKLRTFGQSVWLDFIERGMISSGELERLIEQDGVCGLTSNPAIFEKAISGSAQYARAIRSLALRGKGTQELYEALAIEDIQHAADLFRPIYERTGGADGLVSLEVSPHLAHDAASTVAEARRLWAAVGRPNAMIKVPATLEGIEAIRVLIAQGVNVNVTLLFSISRYRDAALAYLEGLERRLAGGGPIDRITSVASFFLSRIDVSIDSILEQVAAAPGAGERQRQAAAALKGRAALACAKAAYQEYRLIFGGDRFRRLLSHGAKAQRLLWASTSTKNPAYSDVMYVEPLIGPETITTLPPETIAAYRDHGDPAPRLKEGAEEASKLLQGLSEAGIDLESVWQRLEAEGVEKFVKPYDLLLGTLEARRQAALAEPVDPQLWSIELSGFEEKLRGRLDDLEALQAGARLWGKDPGLWAAGAHSGRSADQIRNALGWLEAPERMEGRLAEIADFVREVRSAGIRHVVDLGMGGSTLAPLAFARIFEGHAACAGLPLAVLDTTDPATIIRLEQEIPLADTLFIVASKSGTTAESDAFSEYFFARLSHVKGPQAGENFVAVTDPETPLARLAETRRFRRTFLNFEDIGGRYSALTFFGLLPAALSGVDVGELLIRALRMARACGPTVRPKDNPGIRLGAALAEFASAGRDKLTFVMPESIAVFGMWLEQLIAESTGKQGTGILPVTGESLGPAAVYDRDRVFVYLDLETAPDRALERCIEGLKDYGHPVITLRMGELVDLGQELFRWEVATAIAGAILGINPFDQPNVQETKDNTNRLLAMVKEKGGLPQEKPLLVEGPLEVYAHTGASTVADALWGLLSQLKRGDYFALLAYLTESEASEETLQKIRHRVRDTMGVATTLGYGPRFLHSTGQLHKGGPDTGVFLQITAEDKADIAIPGKPYTFGLLRRAQAIGDLEALRTCGRRVLRVHIRGDEAVGLEALLRALGEALAHS